MEILVMTLILMAYTSRAIVINREQLLYWKYNNHNNKKYNKIINWMNCKEKLF